MVDHVPYTSYYPILKSVPPKMTYIVSGGALNSTHSLTHSSQVTSVGAALSRMHMSKTNVST